MSVWPFLVLGCALTTDPGGRRAPDGGKTGNESPTGSESETDDPPVEDTTPEETTPEGTTPEETPPEETPPEEEPVAWVRLIAPAEGETVTNPVTFVTAGEGVDRLVLDADGWTLADWQPDADGWRVSYTFSGTGYARDVTLTGYAADGSEVATVGATITVEADGVDLAVPYFYQYDNRYEPSGTCGITSTAMAINWWYSGAVTPDELYINYGKAQGQSPSGIASIQASEGLYSAYTLSGTRDEIRAHLDAGRPVIAHGYWTGPGHITVIVGYDDTDWIVNDPAGDWYVCYGCGYADHVRYPIGGAWDDEMSRDGDIWYSTSSTRSF